MRKKLEAIAKLSGCSLAFKWIRALVSHMHWCANSTPDGSSSLMLAKWMSVSNHIVNVHNDHHLTAAECKEYKHCDHEVIPDDEQREWFTPGKFPTLVVM